MTEMLGFSAYDDVGVMGDVYNHPALEGAATLARVNVPEGQGAGDDDILLLADGRLAMPNTLAGMVEFTTNDTWTGCAASIAIANLFQQFLDDGVAGPITSS